MRDFRSWVQNICCGENLISRAALIRFTTLFYIAITVFSAARADWMNLTGAETAPNIAEIRVLEDRVNVRLRSILVI